MNTLQEINPNELNTFKLQIQQWLELDSKISTLEKQIRDMKKMKNKSLEPQITSFMVKYNISDINTTNGKLKCNKRNTKKPLNKTNIRENLSKVIPDTIMIDQAMTMINQREIITTYKLVKPKINKT